MEPIDRVILKLIEFIVALGIVVGIIYLMWKG
jgi:hypothetical protein